MLDIKFIRQNPEIVKNAARNKGVSVDVDKFISIDNKRRDLIQKSESLKAEQKKTEDREKAKIIKNEFKDLEKQLTEIETEFNKLLLEIPNIPSEDTPIGPDASANRVLRQVGTKPEFKFTPKEHWELGKHLNIIDTETASKVSGARFAYIKGALALIEFGLIQLTLSVLTDTSVLEKIIKKAKINVKPISFIPIIPPVLIKPEPFQKMARLEPKEERYYIPQDDLYLIGSAEHTLGTMHMDEVFEEEKLPVRYVGFSTSFRREAGSYGKDMKGIIRVHQFDKLEMESFCLPEESINEQNFIVAVQEYLIQLLELPYQVVQICTGDMGGPDARQIDIETWLPGQNCYRETHTSDLMTDYQARRLNTRVKRKNGHHDFVHMNDATAFAIGRTIIAIMENFQTEEGTIKIPKALHKYTMGLKEIGRT